MKLYDKIFNEVAETKIRMGIGVGWFHEIKSALLISASLKVLFNLSVILAGGLTFLSLFAFWLAGAFDIKFLKIYQKIFELNTFKYNKFKTSLKRKI